MERLRASWFTGLTDAALEEIDERLMKMTAKEVDGLLEKHRGLNWSDRWPLREYDRLTPTRSSIYLYAPWSLPARFAWRSVREPTFNVAVLEELAKRTPGAWAWQAGADRLQPSVWAGVSLARDTRCTKAVPALAHVLEQALQGANTPAERARRAAAVLGGGWPLATDLLGHWGGAGWDATRRWGTPLLGLLKALANPAAAAQDASNPWAKWGAVAAAVADSPEEASVWQEAALAQALKGWEPFTKWGHDRNDSAPSQSSMDSETLEELSAWAEWATTKPDVPWGGSVLAALESLVCCVMASEAERGQRGLQGHNSCLVGIAMRALGETSISAAMQNALARLPNVAWQNLDRDQQAAAELRRRFLSARWAAHPSPSSPRRPRM